MDRGIEDLSHRWPVPVRLTGWWRLFEHSQDAIAKASVIERLFSRTRRVPQTLQSLADKALTPFDDRVGTGVTLIGNRLDGFAFQTTENDLSSLDHLLWPSATGGELSQLFPILRTTTDCGRSSCHAPDHTIYRLLTQVSTRFKLNANC